jgi:hypothetical protein
MVQYGNLYRSACFRHEKYVMVKTIKILLSAVLVLAVAVFIAGFVPVSHPAVTREALKAARHAGGFDSCAAGSVTVALWKGMTVRGLYCSGPLVTGRLRVEAESLVLRGNVIKALIAYKKNNPRAAAVIAFRQSRSAAFAHLCSVAGSGFNGAAVSSAVVVISENKQAPVLLRGLSMSGAFTRNGCSGFFSADSLWYADLPAASGLSGDISSAGEIFRLSLCKGLFFGGALQCSVSADLLGRTFRGCTLTIKGFDFNEWYRYHGTSAGCFSGGADFRLLLDSCNMALDSLHGRGTMTATRFNVSGFPVQRTLASATGYSALESLQFTKMAAIFTIKPGGIITVEASGHNDSLSVKTSGWFSTKGTMDQNVEFVVFKNAVAGLPRFARETLEETADGGRVLNVRIFGALENPKFTIDSRVVLQKAVQNMFNDARNNLKEWLK